jgi:predicted GNAT family acetyltransferase
VDGPKKPGSALVYAVRPDLATAVRKIGRLSLCGPFYGPLALACCYYLLVAGGKYGLRLYPAACAAYAQNFFRPFTLRTNLMKPTITHNQEEQAFYATADGYEAELAYSRPSDTVIDFTHTFVDENLRGQGVGEALAAQALDYARDEHLSIKTSCKFMDAFVQRHPEYQALRATE